MGHGTLCTCGSRQAHWQRPCAAPPSGGKQSRDHVPASRCSACQLCTNSLRLTPSTLFTKIIMLTKFPFPKTEGAPRTLRSLQVCVGKKPVAAVPRNRILRFFVLVLFVYVGAPHFIVPCFAALHVCVFKQMGGQTLHQQADDSGLYCGSPEPNPTSLRCAGAGGAFDLD